MIQGGIRPISCKLFVRSSKSTQPGPCHRSRIPSYMQNPSRMPVGSPAPDPLLSGDLGARAHRVIGSMLRTLLVVLPVVFLATFLSSARTESIAVGTLLVALACVAWLHSRARLVVTICALVGILVAYGIAGAITFGSIRSAAVLAFVGSVIVGGIFLDRRGLAALFALNVTALGALVYAENAGWLVQPHYTVGFLHWLVHAAVIGAVAINVYFARSLVIEALVTARDSRAQLEKVFQSNPAALLRTSLDEARILDINESFVRMFGFGRAELLGAKTTSFDLWADPAERSAFYARVHSKERIENMPVTLKRSNGESFEALISAEVLEVSGERQLLSTVTDISELARARAAQRSSEERLNRAFKASPTALILTDFDTRELLSMNDAARRMFMGDAGDQVPTNVGFRYYADPQQAAALRLRLTSEGRFAEVPLQLLRNDGRPFEARMSQELLEEDGRRFIISAVADVSEEHAARAQAELLRMRRDREIAVLHESLERRVAERTAQLEASNRELEAFSYSVSHDLRAPLRAIDGFVRILTSEQGSADEALRAKARERVLAATVRMNALIEGLIGLARVSRQDFQPQRVDLSALALEVGKPPPGRDPARTELVVEEGLTAMCDLALMRVVLENLFGNAWKFSSNGTHARVEFGAQAQPGGETAFFVRDNGAGFDPEYAHRLFAPFQRLHSDAEFEGTGIGLATVQRVMALHGGRAWATGEPGKGATIYFTCGAAPGAAQAPT